MDQRQGRANLTITSEGAERAHRLWTMLVRFDARHLTYKPHTGRGAEMDDDLQRYLRDFCGKAAVAGLPVRKAGTNWSPLAPLVRGTHVSLSVARHLIQVNLNNEDDADRRKFEALHADRAAVEAEVGEGLTWEKKDGRKKTAVRATLESGYEDQDWDEQHAWAIGVMKRFQASFGRRLT